MVKGLFAGTLGIAVSTVGIAPVEAVRRFFGLSELNGGFSMLTVMIGMFAVAEVIKLAETGRHAARSKVGSVSMKHIKGFGFSLREFRQELPNASRSGLIGLAVGILPGIGAGTSNCSPTSSRRSAPSSRKPMARATSAAWSPARPPTTPASAAP